MEIFGEDKVPRVSHESLSVYREYLVNRLSSNLRVTGREDFLWEEFYVLGPGDPEEYEELKKIRPSYTDDFKIVEILSRHGVKDLTVKVERLSDSQRFEIGLSWLRAVDKNSPDYQHLEDFATWIVNY